MTKPKLKAEECPVLSTFDLLGKKWTLLILSELMSENEIHFTMLLNSLQDEDGHKISSRILSDRLSQLEDGGIIEKKIDISSMPVRSIYTLTPMGRELKDIFGLIKGWQIKWNKTLYKKCFSQNCLHNSIPMLTFDSTQLTHIK